MAFLLPTPHQNSLFARWRQARCVFFVGLCSCDAQNLKYSVARRAVKTPSKIGAMTSAARDRDASTTRLTFLEWISYSKAWYCPCNSSISINRHLLLPEDGNSQLNTASRYYTFFEVLLNRLKERDPRHHCWTFAREIKWHWNDSFSFRVICHGFRLILCLFLLLLIFQICNSRIRHRLNDSRHKAKSYPRDNAEKSLGTT